MDQPGKVANPARGQLDWEKMLIWYREAGSVVPSRVSLLVLNFLYDKSSLEGLLSWQERLRPGGPHV